MSNQSIVTISNLALLAIGSQSQISSLTEGSPQSNACATLFNFVYAALARAARWNCLRSQATLSLLAAAQGTPENPDGTTLPLPPTPWCYMYQLPSNCLAARFLVPSLPTIGGNTISPNMMAAPTWIPLEGQIPFKVAYSTDSSGNPLQVLLTNQSQAQLVFTVNEPNPQVWDVSFQMAMVSSLAAWLVPALSLNMALMSMQVKLAEKYIIEARVADGDEGTTQQDHVPDWMRARDSGDGYNNSYGYAGESYGNMAWPC